MAHAELTRAAYSESGTVPSNFAPLRFSSIFTNDNMPAVYLNFVYIQLCTTKIFTDDLQCMKNLHALETLVQANRYRVVVTMCFWVAQPLMPVATDPYYRYMNICTASTATHSFLHN